VVCSFEIRKIKVDSEKARPSVSSGNNFKVMHGDSRHGNSIIKEAVSQNGGCIHWH
jgi:hypothetical protein